MGDTNRAVDRDGADDTRAALATRRRVVVRTVALAVGLVLLIVAAAVLPVVLLD